MAAHKDDEDNTLDWRRGAALWTVPAGALESASPVISVKESELQMPRVPESCPSGYERYTVVRGDTMYRIARRLGVSLDSIVLFNYHIANPNLIYPGDVLCVPVALALPCCAVLRPPAGMPANTIGAVVAHTAADGRQGISVVAVLPPPQTLGPYDLYTAEVILPDIGGFGNQLLKALPSPPTWATSFYLSPAATLTPTSTIQVLPGNSATGASGPVVLSASLAHCVR